MSRTSSILLAAATCLVLALLPATAGAEFFIPEGNSAVNQYTEGIPTGGGERDSKGAGEKEVRPAQAIGAKNTKKLEQAGGEEGREVAEVVAETAPPPVLVEETESSEAAPSGNATTPSKGAAKQNGKGKAKPAEADGESEATPAPTPPPGDGPGGSGGFGEIVSAATGGSAGGIGLLLPLVIVGAIAWGVGYTWRQRTTHPSASTTP